MIHHANEAAIKMQDQLLHSERWLTHADIVSVGATPPLLSVVYKGRVLFPAFQFTEDGVPHPRLADLLARLPPDAGGWAAVMWCFAPTRKLDGARPVDVFQTNPDSVIDATRRDFEGDNCDW